MPIIKRITSSVGGEIVTDINALALPRPMHATGKPAAAKPTTGRVVFVPKQALGLLQRAGLRPPEREGQLMDPGMVDHACAAARLSVQERLELKGHLRNCGLLSPGKLIR
jgi:hypothetical protein